MIGLLSDVPAFYPAGSLRIGPGMAFSPEGGSAESESQTRPARVLIVEDDYFVSMMIETALLDMRCEIVGIAATGEEASELAERERPDLVLMDIRLAGRLDGVDTAKGIHTRLGIRCLFITAHSDPETRQRGGQANPIGWITKPFTSHELTAGIRSALKALKS